MKDCPKRERKEVYNMENKNKVDDTVYLEYMIYLKESGKVTRRWTKCTVYSPILNDVEEYLPRAISFKNDRMENNYNVIKIRVISEKTGRIVDIIQ